jgi:hypothetical protein
MASKLFVLLFNNTKFIMAYCLFAVTGLNQPQQKTTGTVVHVDKPL